MNKLVFACVLFLGAGGGAARADVFSLYLQGHGGYAGGAASDLVPGSDGRDAQGPILGLEGGARVTIFDGYLTEDEYLRGGSVTRAVAGLVGSAQIARWRLTVRAGAGLLFEKGGPLEHEPNMPDQSGVVARLGGSFDRLLGNGFLLGFGIDGEYYGLHASDAGLTPGDWRTGSDITGSVHLAFELGL
jgi:hypothetical protein